ncbi:MAG: diguanylate cyclase [Epsilonproteobacteria bacterium]|nr:diguanylate cyclase [Campylobacterota bacterium]
MHFIQALKLRSKLFFFFLFVTFGLIFIGIVGTSYINAMKRNVDALYFGSLIPVMELNEITHTYYAGVLSTIHKASRQEMSAQQAYYQIKKSLLKINKKWHSYTSHYKSEEEMEYVAYVAMELQVANELFLQIAATIQQKDSIESVMVQNVEQRVSSVDAVLKKLINYETDVAKYERKVFLSKYESIMKQIGGTLALVVMMVVSISLYVFRSIQEDHSKLEKVVKRLKVTNKKLENASYTDSLTGLYNRRYFNHIYERELGRAKRDKSYITFMILDIDFFKQYNDTYGHVEGDFALKSVAKVLKDTLKRPSDYVFRLGGEEFGVILSATNESDSATLARNICESVKQRELRHEKSKVSNVVTISIGVACCVADDVLDNEILITKADEMLYTAKESGRDRYCITTKVSKAKSVSA